MSVEIATGLTLFDIGGGGGGGGGMMPPPNVLATVLKRFEVGS